MTSSHGERDPHERHFGDFFSSSSVRFQCEVSTVRGPRDRLRCYFSTPPCRDDFVVSTAAATIRPMWFRHDFGLGNVAISFIDFTRFNAHSHWHRPVGLHPTTWARELWFRPHLPARSTRRVDPIDLLRLGGMIYAFTLLRFRKKVARKRMEERRYRIARIYG